MWPAHKTSQASCIDKRYFLRYAFAVETVSAAMDRNPTSSIENTSQVENTQNRPLALGKKETPTPNTTALLGMI